MRSLVLVVVGENREICFPMSPSVHSISLVGDHCKSPGARRNYLLHQILVDKRVVAHLMNVKMLDDMIDMTST